MNRDHYVCEVCGCGFCTERGAVNVQTYHVLWNGKVCGEYKYSGPCSACIREELQDALDEEGFINPEDLIWVSE